MAAVAAENDIKKSPGGQFPVAAGMGAGAQAGYFPGLALRRLLR